MMSLFGRAEYMRRVLSVTGQLARLGKNSLRKAGAGIPKQPWRNTDNLRAVIHQVAPFVSLI